MFYAKVIYIVPWIIVLMQYWTIFFTKLISSKKTKMEIRQSDAWLRNDLHNGTLENLLVVLLKVIGWLLCRDGVYQIEADE